MKTSFNQEPVIIRTERGLTIAGTRISIYDVMDFLKAQYPSKLIQDRFNLTDTQIDAVFSYIEVNRPQVEAEYQEALRTREEIRQYWEDHNREHFARLATKPHKPEQKALWAKLVAQKAERVSVKS
ncbi:MAG: DUF433 domain-containing protein [Coleofasciculaceae cyanobacterium SM2_1_6]|nr:DUF433 domain-containing protein [Coleofasciculaceae cyanobacterium SM2_1_6]